MEKKQIIIAMKGHPGSGKSTLAKSIASKLKCPIIDKDHIRDSTKPIQQSLTNSSKLLNDFSYQVLWRLVSAQLGVGLDYIVVDSPLSRKTHLDHLLNLAVASNALVVVVECRAENEEEWRRRIELRGASHEGDFGWHKPGTWQEMEKLLEDYQGCWDYDVGQLPKLLVDTTAPRRMEDVVSSVLQFVEANIA